MIQNGQPVNAAVTNAAFVSRLTDSDTTGKVGLKNTTDVNSGTVINNAQRAINKAFEGIGTTGEADTTINEYASNNYIADGDNRKVAIEKLDTQLKTDADNLANHIAATHPHPQYATDADLTAGLATKYNASNPAGYQTAAQVSASIAAVVASAPAALDTLNELAAALGNDANFASTVTTSLAGKEPTITAGTASQYYRGDKTFQTLDKTVVGLSSVTNDAQLKRSANDFNTFTEKTTLVDDDIFIIEDSAASGAKKFVKKVNLGASGSGGGGAVNLITNGDAEAAVASIFVPYADAAASRPVDGTGGAPNVTTSITSTNPLTGNKSFLLTKDAANRQGQGWSVPYSVPLSMRAKVLQIDIDYIVNSGTFVAGSSTTDSDVIWYLYDVTNSTLIEPSSIKMLSSSTTLSDKFRSTFQTSATGSSYRLIAHCATTSALAYELKVEVSVSPTTYVYGTPITDWQSFTPTGTWTTNSTYTGRYRRVGDSAQISVGVTFTGAPAGSGQFYVNLPSGLTIDTSKRGGQALATISDIFGIGKGYNGSTNVTNLTIQYGDTSKVAVGYESTAAGQLAAVTQTAPFSWTTGMSLGFEFTVPIQGWSSSVQMSDSADTRIVSFSAYPNSTALAANGTIPFSVLEKDSHGAITGNQYRVPVAGDYILSATLISSAVTALRVKKNGSLSKYVGQIPLAGGIGGGSITLTNLLVGDLIELVTENAATISGSVSLGIFISRISGPSAIAASESVNCSYNVTSSPVMAHNAITTIIYNTKIFDTHGAFNPATGIFTAPISGKYRVSARARASIGTGVSYTQQLTLTTTGVGSGAAAEIAAVSPSGFAVFPTTTITEVISLNAGQTVKADFYHFNSASAAVTIATSNISIEKVG